VISTLPPARVAVAIPAYRAGRTIAQTLQSVAEQTETALEVVVVDDGSDDDTADVADSFTDRIRGLRVLRCEHEGSAQARNRGLAVTTAPYVSFLDADDILHPDALRQQADFLDAHADVALVYSSVDEFDATGDGPPVVRNARPDPLTPLHERVLEGAYACLPSATLQRRTAAEAVDGFREGFRCGEDFDFFVRLALAGFRMSHAPTPRLLYRVHPGQRSGDPILSRGEMLRVLDWLFAQLSRDDPRRAPLRDRLRFLRLMQAGALDRVGRTAEARRLVLASVRDRPRPGHLLEALRLYRRPARVLDWIGPIPEATRARSGGPGAATRPRADRT